MTFDHPSISRRALLTAAGNLVVAISVSSTAGAAFALEGVSPSAVRPPLSPEQLDSFISIDAKGAVTAYFGKIDGGQGVDVAIAQIVADELDVSVKHVSVIMGDTARTVNQGGASNASGIEQGAVPLRNAAAEARRVLVGLASEKLGVPVASLSVSDGIVSVKGQPKTLVSYADLIGGKAFNAPLIWNKKYGNDLDAKGQATPKNFADYKVVGTTVPRSDVKDKIFAKLDYVTDVKVPGMVHGRMIRPPVAGSVPVSIDADSVKSIAGVQIVHKGDLLAVVAPREWDAIRAAEQLKVTWSKVTPPFPVQDELFNHIRNAKPRKRVVAEQIGELEPAFAKATKVMSAEYEWPFQSHSSMGPGCAIVDIKDGKATLWTGTQKPHYARDGVAKILGMSPEDVHGIWLPGPGSYGRNDAGDTAIDAAILAKEVGKPVRVQYMRHEGHAWDPKSPAAVCKVRAALDADGHISAFHYEAKAFSRIDVATSEADPRDTLGGQLTGLAPNSADAILFPGEPTPGSAYSFATRMMAWETVPPLLDRASPLRTSHLRDPLGPELTFASESFMDECAVSSGSDSLAYRLKHLNGPRDLAVLRAVAEKAKWETRVSGPRAAVGDILRGRGVAFSRRGRTMVAVVAEVAVNRKTGRVHAERYTVAHDCGLIINPGSLRQAIENQVVYATSRSLFENATFNTENVTSVDWATYPILDITDAPLAIDVVLINHPEAPATGAGEASTRVVPAALGNAIFDATGVRLRRGPLSADSIKKALSST